MKKKILTLALVVALIAIMVGGTLAYFTADDEVTNTFTIGSVEIEVVEDFESPKTMIPVVTPDETDPNYINKDASVKNTGKNAAYVQMYVAIPKALDAVKAFVVVPAQEGGWEDAPVLVGEAEIDGLTYNVYRYRYDSILAVGEETPNAITAAYLAPELDYDHDTNKFVMNGTAINGYTPGETIEIYVAAQAIQAEGFADYDAALNTGFATHPWANP